MKAWHVVVLCCFVAPAMKAAPVEEFTGREYSETMLLLSQSDFDVRLAAKSLNRLGSKRQSILDLLAEVVWTACSGDRKLHADALSWAVKAIGSTKQARYAGLLDYCIAKVSDEKTVKYLSAARGNLEGGTVTPFEGGKMNLVQMRDRLTKRGGPASGNQIATQFDELRKDRTLNEVYSILGTPDGVSGVNVPGRKVGHIVNIRTSRDMIVFAYGGFGAIRFAYDEAKADWLLADAKSDKGLIWINGDGRFGTLDDQIMAGDEGDLRDAVKTLRKLDRIEGATLDRIADRIYRSHLTPGDDLADALAWLCRILGESGDGRYKQLLVEVSGAADDKAVRRHAGKAASSLPDSPEKPFVPSPAGK